MALNLVGTFQDIASDQRLIQDIREITRSKILQEELGSIFTIVPNIKGGQQVAAMQTIEYITRANAGCGGLALNVDLPALEQKWNPKRAEIKIRFCHTEFEQKFTQWGLSNGYDVKNLGETEFFKFIREMFLEAVKLDMLRIALMGDADIANQNVLADAGKATSYDLIDKGLIPTLQYFKTIPELAENFIDLTKNTGTDQFVMTSDYALKLYESLVDVDDFDGDVLLTSKKLYKNYANYFKSLAGVGVQSSKEDIQKGLQNLQVDGENILPVKNYDRWRKNDFKKDDGNGNLITHLPHFGIFTRKEHLQIGVDDASAFDDLRMEYVGGADEYFYIKGNYMMDFKMTNPFDFKAAI